MMTKINMVYRMEWRLLVTIFFTLHASRFTSSAQSVTEMIKNDPSYAACNYRIYPDSVEMPMTPPPAGKHPFYISHYG